MSKALAIAAKKKETLHTCPDCGQDNFTTRGLAAHTGKKACMDRIKASALVIAKASPEVGACAARFAMLNDYSKKTAAMLKLLQYFGGLEVNRLYDLHHELYGETRGGGQKHAAITLQDFVEQQFKCSARTARRQRDFFLSISGPPEHAKMATRLNTFWLESSKKSLLQLSGTGTTPASLQDLRNVTEADLQTILNQPDEWELHLLFEEPLEEVGELIEETEEADTGSEGERIAHFWHNQLLKKMASHEYLRLKKPQREALGTAFEEAANKIKDTFKGKAKAAKKGGAAAL